MKKIDMIKTVILDFDGTIADTNECITATFAEVLWQMGEKPCDRNAVSSLIGLPLSEMFRRVLDTDDTSKIDEAVRRYGVLFPDISVKSVRLFPNVGETLRKMHDMGLTVAIATSRGRDSLTMLMDVLGITDYISCNYCGEDVREPKPAPEMVLRILADTDTAAGEAVVVGDTWYDIAMGGSAGCTTCGVTYGNHTAETLREHGADHVTGDFAEILGFVS